MPRGDGTRSRQIFLQEIDKAIDVLGLLIVAIIALTASDDF
jgi:hypothetical protein